MLRGFTDSTGVEWRVWEVFPAKAGQTFVESSHTSLKETPFENGWLCFESPAEKRRLAPIPSDWEFRDIMSLEQLCREAAPVMAKRRFA
jgi:hypothetical protein